MHRNVPGLHLALPNTSTGPRRPRPPGVEVGANLAEPSTAKAAVGTQDVYFVDSELEDVLLGPTLGDVAIVVSAELDTNVEEPSLLDILPLDEGETVEDCCLLEWSDGWPDEEITAVDVLPLLLTGVVALTVTTLELDDLDELDALEISAFEELRRELAGLVELWLDTGTTGCEERPGLDEFGAAEVRALEFPSVEEIKVFELTGFENVGLETVGLEMAGFKVDLPDVKEEENEVTRVEKLGGLELSMYDELSGIDELDGIGWREISDRGFVLKLAVCEEPSPETGRLEVPGCDV
ncbi:hypothetical protein X797_007975 [Metarhizium robertsii]|uniref:Uncharacterized protein n=2 Tax=Metarhizium robertsii TaxID=568076 RepID=E9F6N7_METRA|nr:uncharacterized protein MAA_07936 [Metarhizium robertsii ARSEF 23]EFY96653.1 hypothetical protein MAA_07936 [Metarhizium robertsii ARSEF 23]EXU98977.1 hypothetical protein X797_007975 [Metarhizium robertsii]